MRYVCSICGYIYDEAREKQPFAELPDSWRCPLCKAAKAAFVPEKKEEPSAASGSAGKAPEAPAARPPFMEKEEEDLKKLTAGELSALCSNLARGCEKQYKPEEERLFRELADYFAAVTPDVPEADLESLAALIRDDLQAGYPAVQAAADAAGDRGTKRICTWGSRVTNMLDSLLAQYRQEGEALLAGTEIWVCTVCGFVYIGEQPPELCPVCKVPPWKFERIEGRDSA